MFGAWGEPDHEESIRIIHAALDAGINFIDTADVYSRGESEEIVGKALGTSATRSSSRRRSTARCTTRIRTSSATRAAGSPRRSRTRCAACAPTTSTSTKSTAPSSTPTSTRRLGALTDLVRAGKVRYIGSSTFPPSAVVEAQWVAEKRGRERFVTEQPPYSILVRAIERDLLPTCERYGMGVIPWSPLAGGWLTGRYRKGQDLPESRRARSSSRPATTCRCPRTRRSSRPPTRWRSSPSEAGLTLIEMSLAFCSSTRR